MMIPAESKCVETVSEGSASYEDSTDGIEDSSDESLEGEAPQTQSIRWSRKGSYWKESSPAQGYVRTHNILRSCPGHIRGSSIKDAFDIKYLSLKTLRS